MSLDFLQEFHVELESLPRTKLQGKRHEYNNKDEVNGPNILNNNS